MTQTGPYAYDSSVADSVNLNLPAEFAVSGDSVGNVVLDVTKVVQSANTVWAGPTTGSPAVPTFRALVAADIAGDLGIVATASGGTGANNTAHDGHLPIGGTSAGTYVDAAVTSSTITVTPGAHTLAVNLPTQVGVTPGTYSTITSITVDAYGRITALTAT